MSTPPPALKIAALSLTAQLARGCEFKLEFDHQLRGADYDVVVFPELAIGGYLARDLWLSVDYLRLCTQQLTDLRDRQRQWHQALAVEQAPVWVVGAPHWVDGTCFNAAFVLRQGQIVCVYHKNCLATDGVFDEHRYFRAGRDICPFTHRGVRFAPLICEDMWLDDVIERYCAHGVDVGLVLNASPYEMGKQARREQRLSDLAQRHHLPMVATNLCGSQDELVFDAMATAVNRQGILCARSSFLRPEILSLEYHQDVQASAGAIQSLPTLIEQVHAVLVRAIKDYVDSSGLSRVVLGLSGGIDSAVCLCLAAHALGADKVQAVMLRGPYTSDLSLSLAEENASCVGVDYHVIDLKDMYEASSQTLTQQWATPLTDLTQQNLQARLRCCVLMAYANQTNALLLGTTNKSEASVGYGTQYGDLAGALMPLLDLTKTQVYALAETINRADNWIAQGIINRPPSAELAPSQTDEENLMPYRCLDDLIELRLHQGLSMAQLQAKAQSSAKTFDLEQLNRFIQLLHASEYKRRQSPLGIKLSSALYNQDRRYPLHYKNFKFQT